MSWFGKLVGGGLGFAFGGPLGALLGAALGHTFLDSGKSGAGPFSRGELRQTAFFTTVFAMLGKMAKADGQVSREEIRVVDGFIRDQLGLDERARKLAIAIFNKAKDDRRPITDYARQFGRLFNDQPQLRAMLYQLLYAVAAADGAIHPAEEAMLREVLEPLGLPADLYDTLRSGGRAGFGGSAQVSLEEHYATLGVSPDASDDEIKAAYRKAAREYHPDAVVAKGLPEEFRKVAEETFKKVNAAHEAITDARAARS